MQSWREARGGERGRTGGMSRGRALERAIQWSSTGRAQVEHAASHAKSGREAASACLRIAARRVEACSPNPGARLHVTREDIDSPSSAKARAYGRQNGIAAVSVGTAVWTRARGQGEEKKPDNIWGANDVFGGRPERMAGGNGMRRIDGRALDTSGEGHRAQAGGELV